MNQVLVSREGEHVAVITLNRPEQRNALDLPTRAGLAARFEALAKDDTCRAVVITGGPEVFAAGADLRMLVELDSAGARSLNLAQYWKPIADFPKPLIAAVNGLALGVGFELSILSYVIFSFLSALFFFPFPRFFFFPFPFFPLAIVPGRDLREADESESAATLRRDREQASKRKVRSCWRGEKDLKSELV